MLKLFATGAGYITQHGESHMVTTILLGQDRICL
jgi:hypothetical protein